MPASLPSHPQPFFYNLQALRPSQVTVKGDYLVCFFWHPVRVVPSVTLVLWEVHGYRSFRVLGSDFGLAVSLVTAGIWGGLCPGRIQNYLC